MCSHQFPFLLSSYYPFHFQPIPIPMSISLPYRCSTFLPTALPTTSSERDRACALVSIAAASPVSKGESSRRDTHADKHFIMLLCIIYTYLSSSYVYSMSSIQMHHCPCCCHCHCCHCHPPPTPPPIPPQHP